MTILACLISGIIGFSTCAVFSARAYDKGWKDGVSCREGLDGRVSSGSH